MSKWVEPKMNFGRVNWLAMQACKSLSRVIEFLWHQD